MTTNSLIDKLRRRIKDDRPVYTALRINVSDTNISRAIAEVSDGTLMITLEGATESVAMNLSDLRYSTIGRLHHALMRVPGITATMEEDAQDQHASADIYPVAPIDISAKEASLELKHHLFSDDELDEILSNSISRHNPSFDVTSVPPNEEAFILSLAHAEVCRRQAYDHMKRRALETSATDLLELAKQIEDSYREDVKRLARAIVSPQEATPNTMGSGDVVIGTTYRSSTRTGRRSPFGAQSGPTPPILLDPEDSGDQEDESILVRWLRNSDNDFHSYELWMDTRPEVTCHNNEQTYSAQQTNYPQYYHYEGARIGSSQRVFRLYGANKVGQGVRDYTIVGLEPETSYYFRLFVKDTEGSSACSDVVAFRTKALRTRFSDVNPVSTWYGPPNSTVTVNFNPDKGVLTTNHRFYFGEKEVPMAIISDFQATVVVPTFVNKTNKKMLVIESPNQLRHVAVNGFQVT